MNPEEDPEQFQTPGFSPQAGQTLPLKRQSDYPTSLALSYQGPPPPKVNIPQPQGPGSGSMPGGRLPGSPAGPQSPAAEMAEAKEAYTAGYKKPEGFGDRLRNFAGGLGRGAIEGIRSGQGIVPGAISQGALALADPKREQELQFSQRIAPKIAERQGVEAADLEYKRKQQAYEQSQSDAALGRRKIETDIAGDEARTKATLAGIPDPDMVRQKQEAEIERTRAQTEAIRTGKPTFRDLTIDGQIHTIQINPDGTEIDRGVSGAQSQIQSREKIVGIQQAGANARTAQTQAGADRRKTMGSSGGTKDFISITEIRDRVKAHNNAHPDKKISESEAIARIKKVNPKVQVVN